MTARLEDVLGRIAPLAGRWVVLIDGGSGAGKTDFARALAVATGAQVASLDECYPGWDGLESGSRRVPGLLRTGRWTTWDWERGVPGPVRTLEPGMPVIVEGCGALSRVNRRSADLAVWLDCPEEERRRRALGRDGLLYAPHWERWAAQERAFFARERPDLLADVRVDTAED